MKALAITVLVVLLGTYILSRCTPDATIPPSTTVDKIGMILATLLITSAGVLSVLVLFQ